MPRHFLYVMEPNGPAPAGDGDTASWFEFYKWKVEGEVFVPRKRDPFNGASPGDFIWFAFLERNVEGTVSRVVGGAPIVRVEDENRTQEVWYRGDDVYELVPEVEYEGRGPEVPTEVAETWLTNAKRSHA